ncbi:hypothetical protein IVA80_26630 [Bradyrhizobium sp. 139]|uniref:hypothetical protein n=1 Tax=Bradyrhizobium sp. 139 TaxID=2782616 RepID=UPI001FFB94D7|nr:hypothetical protein [Bradyrhizobium sp. 139]MCK1744300.1 hypothetical protein [Bradyrhizobium sp. 139]
MISKSINEYPVMTAKFEDYGWFVAPFIVGQEFTELKALSQFIVANPHQNANDKKTDRAKDIREALRRGV